MGQERGAAEGSFGAPAPAEGRPGAFDTHGSVSICNGFLTNMSGDIFKDNIPGSVDN